MHALVSSGFSLLYNSPDTDTTKSRRTGGGKPCSSSLKMRSRQNLRSTWPTISLSLFGSGFLLGPLIDGLHSRVHLVVYQNGSFNIGPLHSNIWVNFVFLSTVFVAVHSFLVLFSGNYRLADDVARFPFCLVHFTALLGCFNFT